MPSLFDRLYLRAPVLIQNVGISAYGLVWRQRRYGGKFLHYVDEFIARDRFSLDEFRLYQTRMLRSLLVNAEQHVPYYRNVFREAGLKASELANMSLEQLSALPLLEKETIRSSPDLFLAQNVDHRKLHTYFTSGTTGTPLAIKFTSDMHRRWSAAYEVRVRHWAGVNYKMSRAMIGGRIVVPKAEAEPPFWRYNLAERQLYMSAFHISPKNARYYTEALNHCQPDYLDGYASSHFFLARMIKEQGLNIFHPEAVLTSSEKLTPEMRSTIEEVYRCPVFDGYSGLEACCLASECEYHNLHISPDVGIIELLDENGNPVKPGEPGEIVATGLLNFEQPLIRYRTGDLAVWSDEICLCGRKMLVLEEIYGRQEDAVILPDGRMVASFYKVFQGIEGIKEAQVIQQDYDLFTIYLVKGDSFTPEQRTVLLRNIISRYGILNVDLQFVDRIERTERGKFRAVISHVQRKPARPV